MTCRTGGLPGPERLAVGFSRWRDRAPTRRADRRPRLTATVRKVFDDSGGTHGSPRIGIELRAQDRQVSDNTTALLMAEQASPVG
jgi:putative transposase